MAYLNIKQWIILLTFYHFTVPSLAQERLRLGTTDLAPFTYVKNGVLKGSAIAPLNYALSSSDLKYDWVFIENYSLLLKAVRNNTIDGFFVATKNSERDKYATFSKPLFIDYYSWFMLPSAQFDLDDSDFKLKARVGAVEKTNSHRLTIRRGYDVYGQPLPLLAKQFMSGSLDAVFATQSSFIYQLKRLNISPEKYKVIQESARPFGIYISKKYLGRFPDTLKKINRHIQTR